MFIRKSIESVLHQSYYHLEIIIINDGSTDSSSEIMLEYAGQDQRIILVQKENGGIGSAYNQALKLVTGSYLMFLDSDDYFELNAVEELIALIGDSEPDMIHFGSRVIDEETGNEIAYHTFGSIDAEVKTNEGVLQNFVDKLKHPSLINLYKSTLFMDLIIFNQNVGIDELMTPQILLKVNHAIYTSKVYCNVVARKTSVSRSIYGEIKMKQLIDVYGFILAKVVNENSKLTEFYTIKYWSILLNRIRQIVSLNSKYSKATHKKIFMEFLRLKDSVVSTHYYRKLPFRMKMEIRLYTLMLSINMKSTDGN